MESRNVTLDGHGLTPGAWEAVARGHAPVHIAPAARDRVQAARGVVEDILREGRVVYGVSTGFGKFSNVSIPEDSLSQLQLNLIRSHAAGTGAPLPEPIVRGMMLLKANELCRGNSGARTEVLDALVAALNAGFFPWVPERGSVGASGDLAPLAHVALALIGEGRALQDGKAVPAASSLSACDLTALELQAKDGLSLVNGTQLTTSLLADVVCGMERLVRTADVVAALSVDVLLGTTQAWDPKVHEARSHPGQTASAANLRALMASSELNHSHIDCGRVQDAYSLRCSPQVHGAAREALRYARGILERELNASTDNPLVFPGEDGGEAEVISGGNFHAQIPAHAADSLTLALTQLGGISERRMERLVNPALNRGLPAFLVEDGGLNSGLMMAQVTAAALVSECRTLSNPASSQSISTSADQEDFVSMGPVAGRQARAALECMETTVGLELYAACQALDLRRPLKSSPSLEAVHEAVRQRVAKLESDRFLADDIDTLADLVRTGEVMRVAEQALGTSLD